MGTLRVTGSRSVQTHSEEDTAAVGRDLAATLTAGDVLLLHGDLGAGKTAFVRGLAEGLGIPRDDVSSPTFTLIQEYRGGRLPLFHVDLYRIDDPREFDELGLDEIAEEGVLAIEWADKLPAVPRHAIRVTIAYVGESHRAIAVDSTT
jgi:tRNA threonylcarbamoyladenosine biosynthesis protein TsaE